MADNISIVVGASLGGATTLEQLTDVSATPPTTGQVLKWNGTEWVPDTDNNSGGGGGGDANTLGGQAGSYYLDRTNHTGSQAGSTITQDATHRFATDAEKTTWNAKATTGDIDTRIQQVVGAAPTALDTLVELAAALGNNASYAATITTALSGKEPTITAGTSSQYLKGDKTLGTLATVATTGSYADLTNKPQVVVASSMPGDISGYADGTLFIIG